MKVTIRLLGVTIRLPVKLLNFVVNVVLRLLGVFHLDTPNRIVIVLSPLFTALAGVVLTLAIRYFPLIGMRLSKGELLAVFITGATFGASKLLLWLHGWQLHEARARAPAAAVASHGQGEVHGDPHPLVRDIGEP